MRINMEIRLLERQLKQAFGDNFSFDSLDKNTQQFITRVSHTYKEFNKERKFLEHTIKINTDELTEAYEMIEKHNFSLKNEIAHKRLIFEQYLDAIDASYLVSKTDKNGIITYINKQFMQTSGYSKEELIGHSHNIVRHPDVNESLFKNLWQTLKEKKIWKGQLKNRSKDGENYYVYATIFPLLDSSGNVLEYIAVRNNITPRVEIEKNLKKERQYNQMLFHNQENIVFTANKKGIIEANQKFFETLGFSSLNNFKEHYQCICELFIKKSGYLQPTTKEKHWTEDVFRYPNKQHKVILKDTYKQEKIFSIHLKSVEFYEEKFIIASFTDITALEYAREMAEASEKAKSDFMANMSHEIRTPMNGIVGFTELLLKSELNDKQKQFTEYIRSSTGILLKIINDILDFSKIESGNLELDLTLTNPFTDIRNSMAIFKSEAAKKEVSFIISIDSTISECLLMDKLRIIQILTNLVNNAIKFTPNKGKVEIFIKSISKIDNQERILFAVKDTGIGIPKNRQERIFKSFIQADNSTTRNFGGTGLGLSISSSLCKLMDSTLELTSEEGKGSYFFFETEFEICNTTPTLASQVPKGSIYVLDNNQKIYSSIMTQFKHFNIEVITCSFEELLCSDVNNTHIIVTFDYRQYKPLSNNLSKIILVDRSKEAFELAQKENILYHIGLYDEAPSILYNAILNYNLIESRSLNQVEKREIKMNILIAEDYEMNRILIEEMLMQYKLSPEFAFNGEEAVNKVKKGNYELIFMDINMPIMNGIDATKEIRKFNKETPIIALTANALEGDRERYLEQGMSDYISKPIDINELDILLNKYKELVKNKMVVPEVIEEKRTAQQYSKEIYAQALIDAKNAMKFSVPIIIRLFNSFVPNAKDNAKKLVLALEENNKKIIYERAHALRGISLSLKFTTLAKLCDELEYAAKDEQDIDYTLLISKIEDEINYLDDNIEEIVAILNEKDES